MKLKQTMTGIKLVGSLMAGFGVGTIAKNLISVTTPENIKAVTKLGIYVGGYLVAGLAADAASDKFDRKMDMVVRIVELWVNTPEVEQKVEIQAEA